MSLFNNNFVITVVDDRTNVKFSDIENAFRKQKNIMLQTPDGTLLPPQRFGTDMISGVPFVEFCRLSHDDLCTWVTFYRAARSVSGDTTQLSISKRVISAKPIELERVDLEKPLYESTVENIAVAVQNIVSNTGAATIIADGQHYPYITGNQLEVMFGKLDPYTGEFVTFKASQTDTFTRYTRQLP